MAPDPAKPHIAVCPGSYDPITNGHVDVITRASEIFDELIVAVVNASVRKDRALFTAEERVRLHRGRRRRHLPNVRVDTFDVLIVEYARRVGAKAIVKGLRAISDFEYELEMNQLNRHLADDIESVYLMAVAAVQFPVLKRSQGDRHLRGRRLGPRPGRGREALEGSARPLTNYAPGAPWTSSFS